MMLLNRRVRYSKRLLWLLLAVSCRVGAVGAQGGDYL